MMMENISHSLMSFIWNAASLILLLSIVVTIHEGGHFWVARKLGVKVLKFSIGFGKTIFSKTGRDGVEYVIAAIPLGGYVKMLDEREGEVSVQDRPYSFNQASVGKRIAIVAAGPLANFLLAIMVFWSAFMIGVPGVKPVLGEIKTGSIAQIAGLQSGEIIRSIQGEPVQTWMQVGLAFANFIGEKTSIDMEVEDPLSHTKKISRLQLTTKIGENAGESPLETLGIKVYLPQIRLGIGHVAENTPASRAGIKVDDLIVAFNGDDITYWPQLVQKLEKKAEQTVELTVLREGQLIRLKVKLGVGKNSAPQMGYLGIQPKIDEQYRQELDQLRVNLQYEPTKAFHQALIKTGKFFTLSIQTIRKILSRDVSAKNLSGPVGIAESAGNSLSVGLSQFLMFVGMISVSIGFLNLLPIPVLDGGHLFFYGIELVRGKPLSENIQEVGMKIGLVLILSLTIFALFNDISRVGM